ncbi:hypothetical protein [Herpetosiphon llansteffanensis]|uniref:hypothetical protein n=1 Tax=Herpetosiphon llansteffanensis TaxID=2094568 RepID=UPI000D7BCA9F|nr:hypothetical protein [Herpetosiphon llansteffanensis]
MTASFKHWRGWLLAALVGCTAIPLALAPVQAQTNTKLNWDRSQNQATLVNSAALTSTQALTGTWEPNIANVEPNTGIVHTTTIGPNGDLYLGGYFTQIAGVNVNGLVRWDGTQWSALPTTEYDWTTSSPSFKSLSFVGDDLYASDYNLNIGGLTGLDLARWDGTRWHAVGSGIGDNGVIHQLAGYNGELYIFGDYTSFNDVAALNFVRWNGTTVTSMTAMLESIDTVDVLVATSNGVYVSGQNERNIAQLRYWDGTSVRSLPITVAPNSIKVFNDQLYGVKNLDAQSSALMRWNGTAWVSVVDSAPGMIIDYALDADQTYLEVFRQNDIHHYSYSNLNLELLADCACSGNYGLHLSHNRLFVTSNLGTPLIYYANDQWHDVPMYSSPLAKLTAGDRSAYIQTDQLLSWEQNSWRVVPHPAGFAVVNHIQATDDQALYAINSTDEIYDQVVYRYDHDMNTVTSLPIIPNTFLGDLFIVHGETPVVASTTTIYYWNGTSWDSLPLPSDSPSYDLEVFGYDQQLYALVVSNNNGIYTSLIHRWNGTAWVASSPTLNGETYDVDLNANGLYLVGQYTNGSEHSQFMHWNGSQFNVIASSNLIIDEVEATDTGVYVGGWFSQIGNCTCYNLGYWNGSGWQAVGGGVNGRVAELAVSGDRLFVRGAFNQAGTITALGLASWNFASAAPQYTIYLPYTIK